MVPGYVAPDCTGRLGGTFLAAAHNVMRIGLEADSVLTQIFQEKSWTAEGSLQMYCLLQVLR